MRPSQVQKQAMYLSQRLKKQQEPEGGMLLYSSIVKCNLDGTPNSIDRLDALFAQMYKKGITIQQILEKPNHKNFLLTIAVYIGDYVGQLIDEIPVWSSLDTMSVFSDDSDVNFEFCYSLGAEFNHGFMWPFQAIKGALNQTTTVKTYIKQVSSELVTKEVVSDKVTANDIFNQYLKRVRTGKLLDTHMAYHHLLQHIEYDFSYDSLEKIDRVLKLIKAYENLNLNDYTEYSNEASRVDFVYFLGCYIASTAAKLAKVMPHWSNPKKSQSKATMTGAGFEFRQAVRFNNGELSFPLAAITNALFDQNAASPKGAKNYVDNVVQKTPATLSSYPFLEHPITLSSSQYTPYEWKQASTLAGVLAAKCLGTLSRGKHLQPTSLQQPNGEYRFVDHAESNLDELLRQLDEPNLTLPYSLLAYQTGINLPSGYTDGLAIEIGLYGDLKLRLQFVLPYRPAEHKLGFAIYPLINYQYTCPADCLPALAQAFYEGAKQIKDPIYHTDFWLNYYINKHDLFAPAKWLMQPIATFEPAESVIEILPVHD